MKRLLVVHHTPSPTLQAMLEAVLAGLDQPDLADLDVVTQAALAAGPMDVLAADGLVLGTPVNIGYISGAMKHFFDLTYYPCLAQTTGLPFSYYLHGDSNVAGGTRAMDQITKGLGWRQVTKPVSCTGPLTSADTNDLRELGATVAAHALDLL
ncbi:MAG: NAD(P)H-dependent oxidoreductase [Actinomycetia bacterium]|nr:NAD(P)H-dependent oxidoreductase [Actinomycetes bacterium]